MLDNLKKYKIVLASNSPRRKELLSGLDLSFEVNVIPHLDESYPVSLNPEDIPLFIAGKKANAYISHLEDTTLLITADTVVWADNQILGKPENRTDAISMLQALSGKTHLVITGVCVCTKHKFKKFSVTSSVTFDTLKEKEIIYYVDKYRPFDKAGSYGIQEWIGYIGISSITGSFYNVMGLPVQRLYKELKEF